jgi:hypothetical protein
MIPPRSLYHQPGPGRPFRTNTILLGNYTANMPDAERRKLVSRTIVWCNRVNKKLRLK